jgi:tape measure domain-containing protein
MAIEVDIVANETNIESALNKISVRLRKIESESQAVSKSVSNIGVKSIDTKAVSQELKALRQDLSKTNKEISSSINGLSNNFNGLIQGLGLALAGGALTAGFVAATSKFTELENRIALVTGRTDELVDVQKELIDISARTFSSVETSVDSFNRFGLALKSTGIETSTLLTVTENIQKSIAISGGSAQSASAALFQLGQGMAAGALRGQELNSVMEQAPRLATAIADELGVSMGGLRAAAEEGKLTADLVTRAFINQGEAIDEEFKNIAPTLTKSALVFADAATNYIGKLDKGVGLSKSIATQVLSISKAINAASIDLDTRAAKKMEELNLSGKLQTVLLIGGGILNVFSAIISRVGDALPSVITPTLTLFDELAIIIAKIPSISSLVDLTKEANDARTAIIDLAAGGGTLASAFKRVFQSNSPEELRVNLDKLALSIENIGKRWFNVDNALLTVFRQTNIYFLTTGRYLGILDQSLLSLRFDTFEDFGFILRTIVSLLRELVINIFATKAIKAFFTSVVTLTAYLEILKTIIIGTFSNIASTTKSYLDDTVRTIIGFSEKVKKIFYDLYIYLVGNSVWPDTILGIEEWSYRLLKSVIPIINEFSDKVKDVFSSIKDTMSTLPSLLFSKGFDLSLKLDINIAGAIESVLLFLRFVQREVLTAVGNSIVNIWSYLAKNAPVLADIFGAAVVVGIVELLGVSLFGLVKALLTGALIASVVSRIISESGNTLLNEGFFTNLGKNLGYLIGEIFKAIVANIPFLLNALLDVASGFAQGFLGQLSIIGSAISNVLSIFTPVPVAILETALFGGTVAVLLGKISLVTTFINTALTLLTGKSFGEIGANDGILKTMLLGRGRLLIGGLLAVSAILSSIPMLFTSIVSSVQSFIGLGGLAALFLFGPGATTKFILSSIDGLLNYLVSKLGNLGNTGKVFNLAGILESSMSGTASNGVKKKLEWYSDLIAETFSGNENAKGFLFEQLGTDLAGLGARFSSFTTSISAKWAATTAFLSNAWTGFAIRASLVLGLIQARFTAFVTKLQASSLLSGPLGIIGRVLFGIVGAAVVLSMFTGTAQAAENSISDTVNSTLSMVKTGLLAAVLIGTAVAPGKTLAIFAKIITSAFNLVVTLGTALINFTKGLGFASSAIVGSAPAMMLGAKLRMIGNTVLTWAIALGTQIIKIIPAAFTLAFTAAGASTAALAASLGFLIPALLGVVAVTAIFGNSLGDWVQDLVYKITGLGTKATKLKNEIQDLLTVDKVGELDIVLKSKLDEINFSVLSEKEISTLKKELINSNSVFEKNQAIYEAEGDLTRSQIKETNRAIDTSNVLLDKIARRGEKSFATGLLNLFNDNLDGGLLELRDSAFTAVSKSASFDNDSAKRLINPVFNRLDEVLRNPNAQQQDVARALMGFKDLLDMPQMSDVLFNNEELTRIYNSLSRQQTVLERMQVGSDTVATAAELALLQISEENMFSDDAMIRTSRLEARVNNLLRNDEVVRLFNSNQQAMSALISEAIAKDITTTGLSPLQIAKEVGITSGVKLLEFMQRNNITDGTGRDESVLLSYLNERDTIVSASLEATAKVNEILSRELLTGNAADIAKQNERDISELQYIISSVGEKGGTSKLELPEIDYSQLTSNQFDALREISTNFEKDRTNFFSDIFTRLVKEQPAKSDELKVIFDEKGKLKTGELDRFLQMVNTGRILLSDEEKAELTAFTDKFVTSITEAIDESEISIDDLNSRLSSAGLDFELTAITPEQYILLNKSLLAIEKLQKKSESITPRSVGITKDIMSLTQAANTNGLDTAMRFILEGKIRGLKEDLAKLSGDISNGVENRIQLDNLRLDVFDVFASTEDKANALKTKIADALNFAGSSKTVNDVLLLKPEAITRVAQLGVLISRIMTIIQAASVTGLDTSMRVALENKVMSLTRDLQSFVGSDNGTKPDKDKDKGGGDKATWWETFQSQTEALGFSLSQELLAGLSSNALNEMVAAGNRYKAAQDAINKSAADEVELRKASLEQMKLARLEAIDALDDGTFGGVKAQFEALGAGLDASFIGSLTPALLEYAQGVAKQIELLRVQADSMAAGSVELQTTTLAMDQLKMKLEELQAGAKVMSEAFESGLTNFLKGEQTFKGFLEGLLDTFTNTIIEKFSKGFTDSLFSSLNLDNFFNSLFQGALNLGTNTGNTAASGLSSLFGELGSSKANPMYVSDVNGMTGLGSGSASTPGATGGGFFQNIFSGVKGFFGNIFGGISNLFSSLFGGGGLGSLFSLFSGGSFLGGFATGGYVSGPGGPTSDSIMAMLSNGEYVVNAATTKRWLPFLETLNANDGRLPAFAAGGQVGPSNPSAIKLLSENNNKDKQQQVFNINVTGDVSMQARKEIARMIPEITAGVNMTNRERGSR